MKINKYILFMYINKSKLVNSNKLKVKIISFCETYQDIQKQQNKIFKAFRNQKLRWLIHDIFYNKNHLPIRLKAEEFFEQIKIARNMRFFLSSCYIKLNKC